MENIFYMSGVLALATIIIWITIFVSVIQKKILKYLPFIALGISLSINSAIIFFGGKSNSFFAIQIAAFFILIIIYNINYTKHKKWKH